MAKKLTEQELARRLKDEYEKDLTGDAWGDLARAAARALGQELAPEGPELAGWFGEEAELSLTTGLVITETEVYSLGAIAGGLPPESVACISRNRRTLAEGYNRFCRLSALLDRELEHGTSYALHPGHSYYEFLTRLRSVARGSEG